MSRCLHWGLLCLLVPLVLGLAGSGVRAAGDLFDAAYKDCPHRTRLRDGPIADLTVARDADEEKEVNVSWAATDPATWGLGANTYRTSLVVILDDKDGDDPEAKTLSLGTRNVTFDKVETARKVTVQLAIVVDTADGAYLISDILETSIHQSLTAPSFSTGWKQAIDPDESTRVIEDAKPDDDADPDTADFQHMARDIPAGALYYIGYNENFGNYKAGGDNPATFRTKPSTPRLRIGLAHGGESGESDKAREDVDFDAYLLRITDADGDVVAGGHDVATVASDYKTGDFFWDPDGNISSLPIPIKLQADNKLFLYGRFPNLGSRGQNVFSSKGTLNYYDRPIRDSGIALHNVRIVDGDDISVPMYRVPETVLFRRKYGNGVPVVSPAGITNVKVSAHKGSNFDTPYFAGEVFANPPDAHRDFPIDTLASDQTYTITAWAVNDDNQVISPVATLTVHPVDETVTLGDGNPEGFSDYLNQVTSDGGYDHAPKVVEGTLVITEFTVLK